MKTYVVGYERRDEPGGGFAFTDNLIKGGIQTVANPEDCDIYFIPSASMFTKKHSIPKGKKVVLRIDNALKNSRNNNSGMARMKRLSEQSDLIVYQSEWAKSYLSPFLNSKAREVVIVNGIDQTIYNQQVIKLPTDNRIIYLYSRSSNNESKMWELAQYGFQRIWQKDKNSQLWIMGRFSPENFTYNFDFFNEEDWKYLGFQTDKNYMAMIYQSTDYLLFPHFMEACPNTVLEFLSVKNNLSQIIFDPIGATGGTLDIIEGYKKFGWKWLSSNRMILEYQNAIKGI